MAAKAASLRGTSYPYAHFQGGIDALYDRKAAHKTAPKTGPVMDGGRADGRGLVAGSAMEDLDDGNASLRPGSLLTRARDDVDVDVDGAALAGGRSSVWDDEVGMISLLDAIHPFGLTYFMPITPLLSSGRISTGRVPPAALPPTSRRRPTPTPARTFWTWGRPGRTETPVVAAGARARSCARCRSRPRPPSRRRYFLSLLALSHA